MIHSEVRQPPVGCLCETSTISRWVLEQAGIHAECSFHSYISLCSCRDQEHYRHALPTGPKLGSTFKCFYFRPVACSKSFSNTVLQVCALYRQPAHYILCFKHTLSCMQCHHDIILQGSLDLMWNCNSISVVQVHDSVFVAPFEVLF